MIPSSIPFLGIGTYKLEADQAYHIVLNALKFGYQHIDTASLYRNEQAIGKAIIDSGIERKHIFITTKVWKKDIKKGKENIIKSIRTSLESLKLEYIDLILLHVPVNKKIVESWKIMEDIYFGRIQELKNKVRFIGVSNYQIEDFEVIKKNCQIMPHANQIEISPYFYRENLINYCKSNGTIVIAHSSLTKGIKLNDQKLINIASELEITPAILLLSWILDKKIIAIPGTSNIEHLRENLKAINITLTADLVEELNNFSSRFVCFPKYA